MTRQSYRPAPRRSSGGYDHQSSYYPPPPPRVMPPPPPSYPPTVSYPPPPGLNSRTNDDGFNSNRRNDYHFRGGPYSDLRRPSDDASRDRRDFRPPQGDFNFRMQPPPGLQSSYESYRPNGRGDNHSRDRRNHTDHAAGSDSRRPRRGENNRPGPSRGFYPRRGGSYHRVPAKAADRDILHKKHGDQVEVMLGDVSSRPTYRSIDDSSDDDDVAMDISGEESNDDIAESGPASKRARLSATDTNADQSVPKWSNPDPYTALPPPDDAQRKKRDVVQLIRKARVEAAAKKASDLGEAADFISCDFSDASDSGVGLKQNMPSVPSAPTGSRGSSTLPPRPPVSIPTHHNLQQSAVVNSAQNPAPASGDPPKGKKPADLTPSLSLGNRKRTANDEIKMPHASLKRVTKMPGDGTTVPEWRVKRGHDPCPWAEVDHASTPNMAVRLHKEIVDFHEYVRPREFEERMRHQVVDDLAAVVKLKWRDATLMPFGSFKSGLYLPTADMDLVICSRSMTTSGKAKYNAKSHIWSMKAFLKGKGVAHENEIEAITGAKVPLLKFCDSKTGLKIDISFEKLDGVKAIQTFLDWKAQYPAMPILVAVIKHFLMMRGLNEPVNGGIGGFSVICLVVNLLNHNPKVQSGTMVPEHHLGELLVEFFQFYGENFNFADVAIRMNPPGMIHKNDVPGHLYKNRDRLSILDPNNPLNDIAGGSKNFNIIAGHFRQAYQRLKSRMAELTHQETKCEGYNTILAPIFAGNYSSFDTQRRYMRVLDTQNQARTGRRK